VITSRGLNGTGGSCVENILFCCLRLTGCRLNRCLSVISLRMKNPFESATTPGGERDHVTQARAGDLTGSLVNQTDRHRCGTRYIFQNVGGIAGDCDCFGRAADCERILRLIGPMSAPLAVSLASRKAGR